MKSYSNFNDPRQEHRMLIPPRAAPLDSNTLAQHRRNEEFAPDLIPKEHGLNHCAVSRLSRRARYKLMTTKIVLSLIAVNSPMVKAYWNTYYCGSKLMIAGDQVRGGAYCKNRWCLVCNRNRTAQLIAQYLPILSKWENKYFLTLTVPNTSALLLSKIVNAMNEEIKIITAKLNRQHRNDGTPKIMAIRKFECTFNPQRKDFHPHFHLIVDSEEGAKAILHEWLTRFPVTTPFAQDLRPCGDGDCIELFKYFTKMITRDKKSKERDPMNPVAIDTIFQAIRGLRTFQPFGFKLPKNEKIVSATVRDAIERAQEEIVYEWSQDFGDWLSPDGHGLSGYMPTEKMIAFIKSDNGEET